MKLTLKEIRNETPQASSFLFEADEQVTYLAGEHIIFRLPIPNPDSRGNIHTFTLSSSPTEKRLMITTKRGVSTFKQALFALPIGTQIEARGPAGSFILHETDSRPHVMIAGGIGITPFRSMLRYIADKSLRLPVILLYSNKTPQDIVFKKELDEIVLNNPSVHLIYTITQLESRQDSWQGSVGRIDEAFIDAHVKDPFSALFYIAGPESMVDAMAELLGGMHVPRSNILVERFPGY